MPELFNPIGEKVEKVAPGAAPTANGDNAPAADNNDDERAVEEIESLCMNCHQNVGANPPPPHGTDPSID